MREICIRLFIAGVPAVSASTVTNWVNEANRIYRQAAMSFTLASVEEVHGHDEWFNINNKTIFEQMCSYTNNTGGLELYCVNKIFNDNIKGLHSDRRLSSGDARRGLAITASARNEAFSHEAGHTCGLADLYAHDVIAGTVSVEMVGVRNWSGGEGVGYYPAGRLYSQVMYSVLMHNHFNCVIPLGFLKATIKDSGGMQGEVSVGLDQMSTREPIH